MTKTDVRIFNPTELGELEANMWIAYYNHRFARLAWMLFTLNYGHFKLHILTTLRASYHVAAATILFRKTKGHEETDRILRHLIIYCHLLSDHELQPFDYIKAAKLELDWWFIDRYPERYTTTRAIGLAEAAAARFNMEPHLFRRYGQKRAAAMELLGAYHHDPTTVVDWKRLRRYLNESYQALHDTVSNTQKSTTA